MSRQAVQRRIDRLTDAFDPLPDRSFLAYARALITFGGEKSTAASAMRLARYLARGRSEAFREASRAISFSAPDISSRWEACGYGDDQ